MKCRIEFTWIGRSFGHIARIVAALSKSPCRAEENGRESLALFLHAHQRQEIVVHQIGRCRQSVLFKRNASPVDHLDRSLSHVLSSHYQSHVQRLYIN